MKRILITGGAGYIGSTLTRQLLHEGYTTIVFDNLLFGGESIIDLFKHKNFRLIRGDIRNKKDVKGALKNIDCVVHLAALVGDPACDVNPKETEDVNYKGAKILCNLSKNSGIKRFIHISTCSNYGISDTKHPATEKATLHPISLYAKTKVAAEKYILAQTDPRFCVTVLRLATVYGVSPRMRFDLLVNEFIRDAFANSKVSMYQPLAWRPFVHVTDVARAIATCIKAPKSKIHNQIFNIVGKNYQKQDIARLVKKHIPKSKIEILESSNDRRDYNVSYEKIKKILGFKATVSLDNGISEMLTFLRMGIFRDSKNYRYTNVGWPNL